MRRALVILFLSAMALSGCGRTIEGKSTSTGTPSGSEAQGNPDSPVSPSRASSTEIPAHSFYGSLPADRLENAILGKDPVLSVGIESGRQVAADPGGATGFGRLVGDDAMPAIANANLKVAIPEQPVETGLPEAFDRDSTRLLVKSDFEDNDPGTWAVGTTDGISIDVADGRLVFDITEGAAFSWPTEAERLENGSITARVELEGEGDAGVIARLTQTNRKTSTYVCWIHTGGTFGCQKSVEGVWHDILSGQSTTIKPGKLLTIQLKAVGDALEFRINGKLVGSFSDDTLAEGKWGVVAGADGDHLKASFEEISIYEISDKPAPTPTPSPTPNDIDGKVLVDDDFEDGDPGSWHIGAREYNSVELEDGRLAVWVKARAGQAFGYYKVVANESEGLADGSITAEVEIEGDGPAGIIARADADDTWDHYVCVITNSREYACGTLTGPNDEVFEIALSGRAGVIKPDATNLLTLSAEGDTLTFSINEKLIGSFSDNAFERGFWGIYVGAYAGASSTAYYDRITIVER
jgi:hypothetical protein